MVKDRGKAVGVQALGFGVGLLELESCKSQGFLRLMDKILHDPKDPKLWELWYIPYYGSCRICPSTVIITLFDK